MYSKEEIEKKRLMALAKKQQKNINVVKTSAQPVIQTIKNNNFNQNNSMGTSTNSRVNSPWQKNKMGAYKQKQAENRFNPLSTKKFYGDQKTDKVIASCVMIQNNRFAVELSSYHTPIIEIFKTIPSKSYDSQKRLWHFHLKDYDLLREKLIKQSDCKIKGWLPKFIKQTFEKLLIPKEETRIDLSCIEETLRDMLMPFQQEGIRFGISKNGRCIIADDMGLGKTIQALGIAHYFKDTWPLLIVTPSSVRYQWSEAIYKFLPSIPVQSVQQYVKNERGFEFGQVTIVSYDLLTRSIDILEQQFFGCIIFDESHFLKNNKTARYNAAKKIAALAKHVILLSGTPALSRPIELYSQINLLIPEFMGYSEFGIRYCAGIQRTFGWDFSGSSNSQELDLFLRALCLIRRLKSEVLQQLPSKIRQVIVLDPHLIKAGTKEMEDKAMELQKKTLTASERHKALLQYYSESSRAKTKAVCNYVSDLLEKEEKFIIFAHHQNVLDAICGEIDKKKIKYIRIEGKTNPEQRKHFVDRFQDEKDVLVAVLSITAANSGITLTASQMVVFAELTWNPGVLCQAEDRVHRIGQDKGVVIQYLIGKNTADDYLWPKIQQKLDVLNKVGLDQEFVVNDHAVSVQIGIESDQKRIDEFTDQNLSSIKVPHTKPCTLKSPAHSSNKNQTRLDSFVEKNNDFSKQKAPKNEESKSSTNSNLFGSLPDDVFCDIDLKPSANSSKKNRTSLDSFVVRSNDFSKDKDLKKEDNKSSTNSNLFGSLPDDVFCDIDLNEFS